MELKAKFINLNNFFKTILHFNCADNFHLKTYQSSITKSIKIRLGLLSSLWAGLPQRVGIIKFLLYVELEVEKRIVLLENRIFFREFFLYDITIS